jgi:hypothetical protein
VADRLNLDIYAILSSLSGRTGALLQQWSCTISCDHTDMDAFAGFLFPIPFLLPCGLYPVFRHELCYRLFVCQLNFLFSRVLPPERLFSFLFVVLSPRGGPTFRFCQYGTAPSNTVGARSSPDSLPPSFYFIYNTMVLLFPIPSARDLFQTRCCLQLLFYASFFLIRFYLSMV